MASHLWTDIITLISGSHQHFDNHPDKPKKSVSLNKMVGETAAVLNNLCSV
jgi:hypothetical protein